MRLKPSLLIATPLLLLSGMAAAMDAHSFYVRGSALKRQGVTAVLTNEYQRLKVEAESADKTVRAENARATARGAPLFCAPAKVEMNADQLLAEFRRIPEKRRRAISVRQAWREIAIRKYPC